MEDLVETFERLLSFICFREGGGTAGVISSVKWTWQNFQLHTVSEQTAKKKEKKDKKKTSSQAGLSNENKEIKDKQELFTVDQQL